MRLRSRCRAIRCDALNIDQDLPGDLGALDALDALDKPLEEISLHILSSGTFVLRRTIRIVPFLELRKVGGLDNTNKEEYQHILFSHSALLKGQALYVEDYAGTDNGAPLGALVGRSQIYVESPLKDLKNSLNSSESGL